MKKYPQLASYNILSTHDSSNIDFPTKLQLFGEQDIKHDTLQKNWMLINFVIETTLFVGTVINWCLLWIITSTFCCYVHHAECLLYLVSRSEEHADKLEFCCNWAVKSLSWAVSCTSELLLDDLIFQGLLWDTKNICWMSALLEVASAIQKFRHIEHTV
jgi:hypothetical protein